MKDVDAETVVELGGTSIVDDGPSAGESLETSVSEQLAALDDSFNDIDTDEIVEDEIVEDEIVEDEIVEDEIVEDQQSADNAAPTIPAAQVRSLIAYGWTVDEIKSAEVNSPGFASTAAKIHQTRTQEIQKFADMGRQRKQEMGDPETSGSPNTLPLTVDKAALIEKYGSEDLVSEVVDPVNKLLEQIQGMLPDLQAGQQAAQMARMESASQQVDLFFTSDIMTPYTNAYGSSQRDMTDDQCGNRNAVLQMADNIRTGAALRDEDIPIHEAMGMAHEIVGGDFKAEVIRKEIKGKVAKRAGGLTLRPGTQTVKKVGAGVSQEQFEKNIGQRLKALGE